MTTAQSSQHSAPARQSTPRDPSRPTYGGHIAATAKLTGRPLIPWQRETADVAGEIDPATGMLVYSTVIVTVPRQAGKTTLDLAAGVQNCLLGPSRRVWYTAQSGQHASAKWREMAEELTGEDSKLRRVVRTRLTNGSESIRFANGSTLAPHPPSEDSLHSKQSDRNTIDEAWFLSKLAGDRLLQAIVPTTTTRRLLTGQAPQLWIISTEGTVESTFWNPLVDAAREGHAPPGTALFDWGLLPDDDPEDLDVVAGRHPGYGHLLDRATLEDARGKMTAGEFARAYGNRRSLAADRMIPRDQWSRMQWAQTIPDGVPIAYGLAAGVDGLDATVSVASLLPDGRVVSAIPRGGHRPGTYWVAEYIAALVAAYPAAVVVDRIGPSADLAAQLDALDGVTVTTPKAGDVVAAVQRMMQGGADPSGAKWLVHPHEAYDLAADLVTKRWLGDGAFLLGRRRSAGSISALESAVLAAHGALHRPVERGMQLF